MNQPHLTIITSPAPAAKARGDYLLSEAMALREQVETMIRQARRLELEAFAHYAKAEAIEIVERSKA